jgi:hypothetical protein
MPGDPKECREYAAQCFVLASEAPTPVGKERFEKSCSKVASASRRLRSGSSPPERVGRPSMEWCHQAHS